MTKIILAILCTICLQVVQAQVTNDTTASGAAVIIKDTRIAVLEKKHKKKHVEAEMKYNNKAVVGKTVVTRTSSSGIVLAPGYRLMVISTTDVSEANKVRGLLRKYFPDEKIYQTFQMPNSKIKFGNYADRKQADNAKKKILAMKIVTGNIFIVSDQVEMRVKRSETILVPDESGDETKAKTKKEKATTKTVKAKPAKTVKPVK